MNSFVISAITLCLAAQCAIAQYNSGPSYGSGYQQRKMAPTPQNYGGQQGGYGGEQQQEQYGVPSGGYGEQQSAYRAPSALQYEERNPSTGYGGKSTGSSSYGRQASSYGGQQAASYAKPAPKYEEPYHPPMPFAWGYDINDGYGGAQYHKENGDEYGKRTGSYGYTDAYGIYRQVDYVADENGFRATIKTNEPGTANESPADVELHAYEPPSNYYAGNSNSYSQAPAKSYGSGAASSGSYGAGSSSYGGSSSSSSYGSGASNGAGYGPASSNSYNSSPRNSGYPMQQQQGYGSQRPSYSNKQSSGGYGRQQQQQSYEPAAQHSSSVLVPVYQRSAVAPAKVAGVAAPAKRH